MGTLFRVVLYASDDADAARTAARAFERIEELEQKLSDYREDSELTLASSEADEKPVIVSQDLYFVLDHSQRFARLTDGAFDVTVGPLVQLWRESRETGRLPPRREVERRRALVGFGNLLLNPLTRSIRFARKGVRLDLGGIGKGFAADEAFKIIEESGFSIALVDAGRNLRLGRPPPGERGWNIAVKTVGENTLRLRLSNCGVATSGDSEQSVEIAGQRYSHIVDPTTGYGLLESRQATVIAKNAMTADALATAFCVMRPGQSLSLSEKLEGVSVRIEYLEGGQGKTVESAPFPP